MPICPSQLPETTLTSGVFLYCPDCGERSSATRGDYFWHPEEPMTCECGTELQLARSETRVIRIDV